MNYWRKISSLIFVVQAFTWSAQAEQKSVLRTVISNLPVTKYESETVSKVPLRDLFTKDANFIALIQRDMGCPIGQKSTPYIKDLLKKKYKGVDLYLVNYQKSNQDEQIKKDIQENKFTKPPYLADLGQELARSLNITTTTEMVVLDRNFEVRYRGPVNNRFIIGSTKQKYESLLPNFLAKAQKNKNVKSEEYPAPGCFLPYGDSEANSDSPAPQIAWTEIKPLLAQKCIVCHKSEGLNGISLNTLADFKKNARLAQFVVEKKLMPPVNMTADSMTMEVHYSMTDAERAKLLAWLKNIPTFQNEEEPIDSSARDKISNEKYDYQLELFKDLEVPSKGISYYRYFYIKSPFSEDKYITATNIEVDDLKSAHHVNIRIIKQMPAKKQDPFSLEINHLGGYAPGIRGFEIPENTSVLLPKDSYIFVVAHFTPYGQDHKNGARLNLKFTDDPKRKKKIFKSTTIMRRDIQLAKNSEAKYEKEYVIPADIKLHSVLPHLHFRGSKVRIWLKRKSSEDKSLILGLDTFYFHNQINYNLAKPLSLKAGDRIVIEYDYNNTSGNIFNPDPTAEIKSGPASTDEMFYLAIRWIDEE